MATEQPVFVFENDTWTKKNLPRTYTLDGGLAISSDGNTIAVGGYDSNVYIFKTIDNWNNSAETVIQKIENEFGMCLSLSDNGNRMSISSHNARLPSNYHNSTKEHGIVRVYEYETNNWIKVGNDIIDEIKVNMDDPNVDGDGDGTLNDGEDDGQFGCSIALSGDGNWLIDLIRLRTEVN